MLKNSDDIETQVSHWYICCELLQILKKSTFVETKPKNIVAYYYFKIQKSKYNQIFLFIELFSLFMICLRSSFQTLEEIVVFIKLHIAYKCMLFPSKISRVEPLVRLHQKVFIVEWLLLNFHRLIYWSF